MLWTPKNQNPQPVNALPIYMDVNLTVEGPILRCPAGPFHQGVRVHLHLADGCSCRRAHARLRSRVRLEDAASGKVLTQIVAVRGPDGKLVKMSRKLFGVSGEDSSSRQDIAIV